MAPRPLRQIKAFVSPTSSKLRKAIDAGVEFLMTARQEEHWTDFCLPVGVSDAWVAGYVAARLGDLAPEFWSRLEPPIRRTLEWLSAARTAGGGWGYNSTVENDADSTAWVILALRRYGLPVPTEAIQTLERCETSPGEVATYPVTTSLGEGWKSPMPDVTAVALQALGRPPAVDIFFARWLRPDGTLPAYWWASSLYTCAAVLDWIGLAHRSLVVNALSRSLPSWMAESEFEVALLLRCLTRLRAKQASLAASRLVAAQLPDGSWPASALLRLTEPDVISPWETVDAGPLFVDHNSVFTTATAVSGLALYFDRCSP
jgi:hypothetical protein